jgi:hypothetical protein
MSAETDSSSTSGRHATRGTRVVSVFAALLLFYVLSPTPLGLVLIRAFPDREESIQEYMGPVYAPLEWLYTNNEYVERFYDWYMMLWEPLFPD